MIELELHEEQDTALVTLNHPERRNALSMAVVEELATCITELDGRSDIRAIVLTGADPAFCAGFDLKALSTEDRGAQEARRSDPMVMAGLLPERATPIIGAVNGAAVTGGLELALSCDFLIGSEHARFADTHARVGLMPGAGLTIRLPERVGTARALQMSTTGDFIDAERALRWGLLNEVVPHDALLGRALEIAAAIASIPPANVAEIRSMYARFAGSGDPEDYERENAWARRWMADRFDQARLATSKDTIIERGRTSQ